MATSISAKHTVKDIYTVQWGVGGDKPTVSQTAEYCDLNVTAQ